MQRANKCYILVFDECYLIYKAQDWTLPFVIKSFVLEHHTKHTLKYYFALRPGDSRTNLILCQKLFDVEEVVNQFLMQEEYNLQKVHHE